jgi:peptidylprolyl isomerase
MTRVPAWIVAAACATAALAAAKSIPPLAVVGGEAVSGEDLRQDFVRRHGGHAKFLGGASEVRSFLDQVIDRRLLLQEAYRLGLDELPAVRQASDETAMNRSLEWLVKQEIDDRAQPTEEEIRQAWETRTTTLWQVLQLAVADRDTALDLARQIAAGAEFETLVRERSIASSRIRGGMLPSIGWGSMTPEWEAAVFPLAAGETTAPFETAEGWQIVRVIEKKTVEKPAFDEARSRVESILKKRKLEQRRAAFSQELWKRYGARLADGLAVDPKTFAELARSAPKTALATWNGGALDLETFARGLDLAALAALPGGAGRTHLADLLRKTVNDALLRLEVAARRIEARPEIAAAAKAVREQLMESALYSDYLLRGVELQEAEVRAWYEAHRGDWVAPERRHVAHIVAATREAAEALRVRLDNGEPFEKVAAASSQDPQTAKAGGDLGWVTAKETPAEFAPVMQLAPGEVSAPLQSAFGWHLVKVLQIDAARQLAYEEVADRLRQQLLDRKRTEKRAEWIRRLRAATPIEIDSKAIEAFAKQTAASS